MSEAKNKVEIFQVEKSSLLPFGAYRTGKNFIISIPTNEKINKVVFYNRSTKEKVGEALISEEFRNTNIYSFQIKGVGAYNYSLMNDKKKVKDPYAKVVNKGTGFGKEKDFTYGIYRDKYDWNNDKKPKYSYEDSFIYRLHVRGFTKHSSSKVKNKGTYAGIIEKIPYFKELGITALELMPCYEFDEVIKEGFGAGKVNYWGYGSAYYFSPKESYSSKKNGGQVNEFKDMVKALHKAGIEVIMDFYFIPGTNPNKIVDCLRYWVIEYHIDGVHLNMEVAPVNMIKEDPILAPVKIFANRWDVIDYFSHGNLSIKKNLAIFNDDFMINTRRFVKSDEGQIYGIVEKLKRNPANCGIINYLANHYSFTLMDTVSYDRKHNEENGEDNHDGEEYNYSWNCGVEGATKRKKVKELRIKQIKNAFTILFLSQGTPMIYAGDEMGRSQKGNNNPYCQDNEISWINWNLLKTNAPIFDYVKELVEFRKDHNILHGKEEPKTIDYLSKGSPDMSYHGTDPWRVDFNHVNRQLAVLYNGAYANGENSIYVAFNMYWEDAEFNIPTIEKDSKWKVIFITDASRKKEDIIEDRTVSVPARTIVILEEIKNSKNKETKNDTK